MMLDVCFNAKKQVVHERLALGIYSVLFLRRHSIVLGNHPIQKVTKWRALTNGAPFFNIDGTLDVSKNGNWAW